MKRGRLETMTPDSHGKTALVVVDAKNPDTGKRYRSAQWRPPLEERGLKVEEYCVPDLVKAHAITPIKGADLVVVNWDALNGDPVCEADVTLRFFESHGKPLLSGLMSNGGVLFCEFQTVYGVPTQASYDALFGKREITVLDHVLEQGARSGTKAVPFPAFADHPLVPLEGETEAHPDTSVPPFPGLSVTEDRHGILLLEAYPPSLWFGWFTSWSRDWIPLLCAVLPEHVAVSLKTRNAPILLARTVDRGLMVASTMLVARAGCTKLIDRLAAPDLQSIRAYHKRARLWRTVGDVLWAAALLVVLAVVALGLWKLYASASPSAASTLVKLGLSVLSAGVFTLFSLFWPAYWTYVWRRPLGLGVVKTVWARLRSSTHA
jgi:hypothetical protein